MWLHLSGGPIGAERSKMSSVICLGPWYSWLESWDVSLSFYMVSYHLVIQLKLLYILPCSKMVEMETVWSLKAYALEFPRHFLHILLVRESHKSSPDSREK